MLCYNFELKFYVNETYDADDAESEMIPRC